MLRQPRILALCFAIASAALCADGDFQWQGELAPGKLLAIRGVNGSIRAFGSTGNTASITAHKTGKTSNPDTVAIRVVPFDGGVVVCAMYPDDDSRPPNTCNPPGMNNFLSANNNDVQVEFTVTVPKGVQLAAHTVNGEIQALLLTGDVDASTVIGGIALSTTGGAQATTLHGSILASIGRTTWSGVRLFDTGDGSVDLQIPSDANVSVRASAFHGAILSDFPLTIMTAKVGHSSMASGTIGGDGRSLRLSSFNGDITLRKGPPGETQGLLGAVQPTTTPDAPTVAVNGVVNGASFAPANAPNGSLAPGSIAALFGTNLATAFGQANGAPLPTTLSDTDSVMIGSTAAPLFFVSSKQINLQIPFETAPGTLNVEVSRGGQASTPQPVTILPASPGIFTMDQTGAGQGAIVSVQGTLVNNSAPAAAGDPVLVFGTGLGTTTPAVATGAAAPNLPLATVNLPVTATVGNVPAPVPFAGLAPGFVGLYQVNVQIPPGVAPGNSVPLVLTQNGVSSNSVTLAIKSSTPLETGLAFSPYVVVQGAGFAAGEPTLSIGKDGTLWITDLGPAQIWKSSDRGATWSFIAPPLSLGGGDMDAAQDDAGRLHVLDQGSTSRGGCIFYYRSSDAGHSFDLVEATHGGGIWLPGDGACAGAPNGNIDRPWVATWGANTVYIVNKEASAASVNVSRDGGQTFSHAVPSSFPEPQGIAIDPADGMLYLIGAQLGGFDPALGRNTARAMLVAASPDGQTFSSSVVVNSQQFDLAESEFPSIAVDAGHNVYATWSDNSAGTIDVYVSVSRDRGMSWSAPIRVSNGLTVSVYPTIVAGDAGRVAVAWYGTSDPAQSRGDAHGATWYVYAALSTNILDANPSFESVKVSGQPFHHNSICAHLNVCEGIDVTAGQKPPGFESGILDFFRMAVDSTGALNVVWSDTTEGGPKNHFARQTAGRLLREASATPAVAK